MLQHKGTAELQSDRLLLRRFTLDDTQLCFQNWMNNPLVTEFLTWPAHKDLSMTAATLTEWVKDYQKKTFYQWAIILKTIEEPIGSISVVEIDEKTDALEIGYCIGNKWWHQGYTSEALRTILPFLFDEVKAQRIEARHDTNNPNSGAVMKKCGLRYEGTLRKADLNNRGIVDVCIYGILAKDYQSEKAG